MVHLLRIMASDCLFGVFKLFLNCWFWKGHSWPSYLEMLCTWFAIYNFTAVWPSVIMRYTCCILIKCLFNPYYIFCVYILQVCNVNSLRKVGFWFNVEVALCACYAYIYPQYSKCYLVSYALNTITVTLLSCFDMYNVTL